MTEVGKYSFFFFPFFFHSQQLKNFMKLFEDNLLQSTISSSFSCLQLKKHQLSSF